MKILLNLHTWHINPVAAPGANYQVMGLYKKVKKGRDAEKWACARLMAYEQATKQATNPLCKMSPFLFWVPVSPESPRCLMDYSRACCSSAWLHKYCKCLTR